MAGRQDEAVAVGPVGIGGVIGHDPGPEHVGQGSERHRRALVAAVGGSGRVHGQTPDHVDGSLLEIGVGHVALLTHTHCVPRAHGGTKLQP